MKQSRFTEIQIIGILKKADSGIAALRQMRSGKNTGLAQLRTTNGSIASFVSLLLGSLSGLDINAARQLNSLAKVSLQK